MAAARRRSPPLYVLNHDLLVGNSHAGGKGGEGWADPDASVDNGNLTGKVDEGWTDIEIARREAYGCGHNLRQALNGLSLCVRLGDFPLVTSTLGIGISRDARDRFISELGVAANIEDEEDEGIHIEDEEDEGIRAHARIMMQQQDLLIIGLLFQRKIRNMSYSTSSTTAAMHPSMVSSSVSDPLKLIAMFSLVPKRTSDGAFELFHLGRDERDDGCRRPLASDMDPPPFLCVFSSVTGDRACAWETRRTLRWNVPVSVLERFRMDAAFSVQGKGVWAGLSQALINCDLRTDSDDPAVDLCWIELPSECHLSLEEMLDCTWQMKKVTRTIACVGDSIWLVCICRGKRHGDDVDPGTGWRAVEE